MDSNTYSFTNKLEEVVVKHQKEDSILTDGCFPNRLGTVLRLPMLPLTGLTTLVITC